LADALLSFEEDLAEGRYAHVDVVWRATLRRAADISRAHTPKHGCRSLDVLHVPPHSSSGCATSSRSTSVSDKWRELSD